MDKNLKQKDDLIRTLSEKSDALQQRRAGVEARLTNVRERIPVVQQQIMDSFVTGADLVPLDKERRDLVAESETLALGLRGISAELDRIENELSRAITDRNERFSTLVGTWLTKEGASFNSLVDQVRAEAKRLFAAKQLLTDMGDVSTFAESLGSGANYLHQIVLPTLCNGFVASDLQGDRQKARLRPTTSLCQEIFGEITK